MSEDRLREEALAALEKAKPEDFDGHTEFHRMTPLQRLRWLDQAVAMVLKLRLKGGRNGKAKNQITGAKSPRTA